MPKGFQFQAGQHTKISFRDQAGDFQRFYSIASPPHFTDRLEFCIQLLSDGRSAALIQNLKAGQSLKLDAAQGNFGVSNKTRPLVFIAGGSGIGPLRSLILDLLATKEISTPISLIYGCKDASIIPYYDEFRELRIKFPNRFRAYFYAENGPYSTDIEAGNILQSFHNDGEWLTPEHHFYLCGPNAMNEEVIRQLERMKIPRSQIFKEY
jgi:ferredoxin-NADP reductase